MVYDMLYDLQAAAKKIDNKFSDWPVYAITRQVSTGRSSRDWDRALERCNPVKLLTYILKGDLSDDEMIKNCTKYMKRYAGYKEESSYL